MRGSREPRAGYRFGFHGHSDRERVDHQEATVDEILESLGRRTQLADTLSLREAGGSEEARDFFDARVGSDSHSIARTSLGRYVFGLMLIGGVAILVLYGFFSAIITSSPPASAGSSLLGLILNDPVKLGLLGILCLVPVIMARRRRGRLDRLSPC